MSPTRYRRVHGAVPERVGDDKAQVGPYVQTNVRIPDCAWDALEVIKGERRLSRDETVRQLLAEHVAQQEAREPEAWLTHISTLLRHPQRRLKSDPPVGRVLRLRLPPGLADRARAVSYRLPGQPVRRGHRDYQARLLTDAVVTAIAVAAPEPLTDEVLEGLLSLLRHQAANGLWRLAVAATLQGAEREVRVAAEPPASAARGRGEAWIGVGDQRRVHYVADALRDDVAWHGNWRRLVLEWLARRLLVGDRAAENEQMLFEQRAEWGVLQHDLENRSGSDHWLLRGLYGDWEFNDLQGRGGTAVWRAERKVDLQEFECWVMGKPGMLDDTPARNVDLPTRHVMRPQGWVVDNLGGWRSIVSERNPGPVPEPWATHVAEGRMLLFLVEERQVLWPVIREAGSDRPVDGIEVILAAASRRPKGRALPPLALIESILLRLDDHDEDDLVDDAPIDEHLALDTEDRWELLGEVRVPVYTAHRLGLIDNANRDEVLAQGSAELGAVMRAVIKDAPNAHVQRALRGALTSPTEFRRIARSMGLEFTKPPATWVWPVRSLADEVLRGTRPEALEWLSNWVFRHYALGLERSMQNAWHRAFQRFQPPGEGYVTSTVIRGALMRSRLESESKFVD